MDKEKFIDLINKEIDGIISTQEKKDLLEHLENYPKAKQEYYNQTRSIKYLNELDEVEPPEDLKYKILNSIDFDSHIAKEKKKRKNKFPLLDFLLTPKPKLAYAFTFGTVFGFLVYSIFIVELIQPDRIKPSDATGTMGINYISGIKNIVTIPVSLDKISGEIVVNQHNRLVWFDIKLNIENEVEIVLEFEKNTFNFENYNNDMNIQAGENFVKIQLYTDMYFPLFLLKQINSPTSIDLKMLFSDESRFSKKIEIN